MKDHWQITALPQWRVNQSYFHIYLKHKINMNEYQNIFYFNRENVNTHYFWSSSLLTLIYSPATKWQIRHYDWSFRLSVKLPTRGQLGWFYFADLATLFIGQDSVQLPRVVSLSVQCKCRFWIWVTFKRWCKLVIKKKGLINKSGLKSNQGLQCKWGLSHLWCSMVPSVRNQDAVF